MSKSLKELKQEAGLLPNTNQTSVNWNQFTFDLKESIRADPSILPSEEEMRKLANVSKAMENYGSRKKW